MKEGARCGAADHVFFFPFKFSVGLSTIGSRFGDSPGRRCNPTAIGLLGRLLSGPRGLPGLFRR